MLNSSQRLKKIIILGVIAALSIIGYILYSHYYLEIGFPLDDAWIHQTYARNIVEYGEWVFIPGELSAGSTSPLWTLLLVPGYLIGIPYLVWTFFIGWLMLWMIGWVSMVIFEQYCPNNKGFSFWVGICMVLEWHLIWAAVSGMETIFISLLILLAFIDFGKTWTTWLGRGLLVGITIWVRPDGIVLLFPIMVIIYFTLLTNKSRLTAFSLCCAGILALFIPYIGFNRYLSGDWWPNTFYAKQAEYAIMREISIFIRYFKEFVLPLVGVGAILLPGFLMFIIDTFKSKKWENLAMLGLFLGYIGIYALRLPVTYQHGRYIIPVMSLYFLMGYIGFFKYYRISMSYFTARVFYKTVIASGMIVLVAFWVMGAQQYAKDVGFIQTEMVATARWIEQNTKPDAIIAAHDIGALGFWGNRKIIDMAGLISPEIIPIIRDEKQIQQFLNSHRTDYFMTFPDWYPYLSSLGKMVYRSDGEVVILLGGENMVVYQWLDTP